MLPRSQWQNLVHLDAIKVSPPPPPTPSPAPSPLMECFFPSVLLTRCPTTGLHALQYGGFGC